VEIRSDRSWVLPAPPAEVWEAMASVEAYARWWPWLRNLDAAELAAGAVWRCELRPPFRTPMRLAVAFERVEAPHLVTATVAGDVVGPARLELRAHAEGSEVRLRSALAPHSPGLRRLAGVLPPLAKWGHDQVLDRGARQFAARALDGAVREA
jgi:hypothetical protein